MGALWEKLDGKQLALIVTSVGGIVLAGLILYFYSQATNNHIEHGFGAVSDAIKEHNQADMEVKRELISTLKGVIDNSSREQVFEFSTKNSSSTPSLGMLIIQNNIRFVVPDNLFAVLYFCYSQH